MAYSFGDEDGMAWTPSPSILSIKARTLKKAKKKESAVAATGDDASLAPLKELYSMHGGDLVSIFMELGDDPGKAIKYPPKDASEFATKYIGGFYTYIDMKKVQAKISQKRAAKITQSTLLEFFALGSAKQPRKDDADAAAKVAARKAKENDASSSMTAGLEKLFEDKGGDLVAVFEVLGEDPGKAVKYPPASAAEFATKYLSGGYTYVEVRKAPSKSKVAAAMVSAAAGGEAAKDPMTQGFEDLYTANKGDLVAIFEVLGENPGKAIKYPPKDAHEFASKYIAGQYTYVAGSSASKSASKSPPSASATSGDPMVLALQNLYEVHLGDLKAVFELLGEDPTKALKYPPADGASFAAKYLEGCYTYYTAPVESDESVAMRMEQQDEALSPMEVLLMLFPDVEPALLEAAFQEANGHLEQTVELLLTAMFFSSLDTKAASVDSSEATAYGGDMKDTPPPPPPGGSSGGVSELVMSELGDMKSNGEDMKDQVLALTVPPGAVAGDLVRFVTPAGAIVAEVPEGVEEGQPFFVRLQPVL